MQQALRDHPMTASLFPPGTALFGPWRRAGCSGGMLMLGFAVLGYLLTAFGYPVVIVIIAFFLGPHLEVSVAQSLALTNGDPTRIAGHPVAVALLILSGAAVVYLSRRGRRAADHGSGQQAG